MKSMPNINITRQQYDQMLSYNRIVGGGEGIIFTTPNPNSVYKIFRDYETSLPVPMSDNKYKKIKNLVL